MDGGGFSVYPKDDCPHTFSHILISGEQAARAYRNRSCSSCNDPSESWICFHCAGVNCSRHVKGHAGEHSLASKHFIAASCADLSVWCYECDSYIVDPASSELLAAIRAEKFKPKQTGDSYFVCNQCFGRIESAFFHCLTCDDYDLCSSCHSSNSFSHPHQADHKTEQRKID